MAEKKKKTDKISPEKKKKLLTKKQKLIRALLVVAIVLGVLLLLAEVVLPALGGIFGKNGGNGEDDLLNGGFELDEYDRALWQDLDRRTIVYGSYGSVGKTFSVLTNENIDKEEFDQYAPFWLSYINSIRNGDEKSYASHYAANCVFDNVIDPYCFGDGEFDEQRIYDVEIFKIENENSPESTQKEKFEVTYKIFRNTGTFRMDLDDEERRTAPYIMTLEKTQSGKYLITKVEYKYKP